MVECCDIHLPSSSMCVCVSVHFAFLPPSGPPVHRDRRSVAALGQSTIDKYMNLLIKLWIRENIIFIYSYFYLWSISVVDFLSFLEHFLKMRGIYCQKYLLIGGE